MDDDDLTEGTIEAVLARVGTDKGLAERALEQEQAKPDDEQRSTLIDKLERIATEPDVPTAPAPTPDTPTLPPNEDGTVGPEVFVTDDADDPVNPDVPDVGPERFTIE